jgi:SAM-dependent methyltransferase
LRAPSIPDLSINDLIELRKVFDTNNYSSDPSAEVDTGPTILKMLFARGLSIDIDKAERIFDPQKLENMINSGLLSQENGEIKSLFQAQPYRGMILFSDFYQWEDSSDYVLPIGPAGHYLANLTIRRKVNSTLDLGCGCGIQSILAARHSDHVIATDINPRALALTRLNAVLNGFKNIETLEGSYFEPLQGQNFDLILANLPYVITPENRHIYSDVDQPGNLSIHKWLIEIPNHIREGGFAQVLVNWVHRIDEAWWLPIRQTLADSHSDTWLIYTASKKPDEYADIWIDQQTRNDPVKFKKTKQAWLKWYQSNHIPQIALGAIVMRRRTSVINWFQAVHAIKNLEGSAEDQIERLFAMQDFLISLNHSNGLLDKIIVQLDIEILPVDKENRFLVSQINGLRLETEVQPATLALLRRLDDHTSFRSIIETLSPQPEFATTDIRDAVEADIKTLLKLGMVKFL